MEIYDLIEIARKYVGEFELSEKKLTAATVAAAIVTNNGNIYTGVCLDMICGIGFCAEHAAIAEMLKNRETEIEAIVAVKRNKIKHPCGRCRELIYRLNFDNLNTKVIIGDSEYITLKELLPYT